MHEEKRLSQFFYRGALQLKAISLYTGVGGLDFGFEAAGFETAVAVELDATACRTLRLNRDWPVLEGDIHGITTDKILEKAGLGAGEADVLIGGPPCQPFSKSGYWARGDSRRLEDERAGTLRAYMRVLREARPKAFLLENVQGIAYRDKDEGLQHILDELTAIDQDAGTRYRESAVWRSINAAGYGVPQIRERVFVIGSRDGAPFAFPPATYGPRSRATDDGPGLAPYRTVWDAIGDVPERLNDPALAMTGKWADLLPSIPEGQNYLWHTPRMAGVAENAARGARALFGWRTRYWSFLLKLAKDQPSWTIQAQPGSAIGPFHWTSRKLSAQELCRVQTFPDGIEFECSRAGVQKLLGNAVASLVAEVLARAIRRQVFHDSQDLGALKLLPPDRGSPPAPEVLAPVPAKYLALVDEHPDHPGEGHRRAYRHTKAYRDSLAAAG